MPNAHYQPRVEEVKGDVEAAIAAMFGASVVIDVVVDNDAAPPPGARRSAPEPTPTPTAPEDEAADVGDITELADASDIAASGVDRLTQAFPGATIVPPPNS